MLLVVVKTDSRHHPSFLTMYGCQSSKNLPEMFNALFRLLDGSTLNAEHDITFRFPADPDDTRPVDHPVAARATHRRAGDLAALRRGMLDGNVLRVQVHETAHNAFQPLVGVLAGKVAVAGVEVDADGGLFTSFEIRSRPAGVLLYCWCGSIPMTMPRGSATFDASMSVYFISV